MAKNRKKKRVANEKQPQGPPEPGAAGPSEVPDEVPDEVPNEVPNPQPQGPSEPGAAGPSEAPAEVPSQELAELHLGDEQPAVESVATGQSLGAIPKDRPATQPQPGAEVQRDPPQAVSVPQQVRINCQTRL